MRYLQVFKYKEKKCVELIISNVSREQDYLRIMYVHTNLYMYYSTTYYLATLMWCLVGQVNDLERINHDSNVTHSHMSCKYACMIL